MKTTGDLVRAWFVRRLLNILPKISRYVQLGNPHGRAPTTLPRPGRDNSLGSFEGGQVYSFDDAIVSGHQGGLVISARNEVFMNLTQYKGTPHRHPGIVHVKVPRAKTMKGTGAYLCTPEATGNYYHWLVDVVPRLWLLEQAGFTAENLDYIFVNSANSAWEIEPFLLHGFRPDQIQNCTMYDRFKIDRLVVPDRLVYLEFDLWKATFLQRLLLSEIPTRGKRLFCGRKDASRRRLVNEDELYARLEPLGFQNVDTRGMTVRQQAQLFASASFIVGVQGAMLANAVFMPAGGFAVEIQSHLAPREFYTKIYATKKIDFWVTYAEPTGRAVDDYDANLVDLVLAPAQIDEIVERIRERTSR